MITVKKQIEEMAKDITKKQEAGWRFVDFDIGFTTDVFNNELAEHLYNAGYRKASDVAREIIDDIDKMLGMLMLDYANFNRFSEADTIRYAICYLIDELKKKYTEE